MEAQVQNNHRYSWSGLSIHVSLVGYELSRPSLFKGWEGRRPGQVFPDSHTALARLTISPKRLRNRIYSPD